MNDAEQEFALWATGEGWTVTKRGWPDFLCFREDEVMAVEVKWSDGLGREQEMACRVLAAYGIPTFVWVPPGPLDPFELVEPRALAGSDAFRLSEEVGRLLRENLRLRRTLAETQMAAANEASSTQREIQHLRADLSYLLGRASWIKERTPRLLELLRRYPDLAVKVRPGRRLSRHSMSGSMSRLPADVA